MNSQRDAYDELCLYTLAHSGPTFIHQHVVDAFAAQDATSTDKPIRLVFALVGLFLHVERGFTGREVRLAHMQLGRRKQTWPMLPLPQVRGTMTAATVLAAPLEEREQAIHDWCVAVWTAFVDCRGPVEKLLAENGVNAAWSVRQHR